MTKFILAALIVLMPLSEILSQTPGRQPMRAYGHGTVVVRAAGPDDARVGILVASLSAPCGDSVEFVKRAVFPEVEVGEYNVVVEGPAGFGTGRVSVRNGQTSLVEIELTKRSAKSYFSRGRVLEPRSREPVEGLTIWTADGDSVITAADGGFVFYPMREGVQELQYMVEDYLVRWPVHTSSTLVAQAELLYVRSASLPVQDGLVSYYPLDGHATDFGPLGQHGTVEGAKACANSHGTPSGALEFNGETFVDVPHTTRHLNQPITIAFRFKVDSTCPKTVFIVGKYLHPSGEGWTFFLENGLLCAGDFRDGFSNWSRINTRTHVRDGNWHTVALLIDREVLRMMVDGTMTPARPYTAPPDNSVTTQPLRIGKLNSTIWDPMPGFVGAIDDLVIYDRILSESELIELFN